MPTKRKTNRARRVTASMLFGHERKQCPFKQEGITEIDYKDIDLISKFIAVDYKLIPSRVTGVSSIMQRKLSKALKKARYMALIPYTDQQVLK